MYVYIHMRLILPIEVSIYIYMYIHMRLILPIEGQQLCICMYVYEANTSNRRTPPHTHRNMCV